jgi:hypothetical protein
VVLLISPDRLAVVSRELSVTAFDSDPPRARAAAVRGLSFILLLSAVGSFGQQAYNWKSVTIKGGGFVSGIIMHPNAPGAVYCRTDIGGAYRWNPTNSSWIPLLDFAADANTYGIESVAIDPSDGNRLYLAASRGSSSMKWILASTNQGATFSSFSPPFSLDGNARGRGDGERMAVDPNLGSILFYGTKSQGLYKSVNRGTNWSQVTTFPVSTTANGVGIVFLQFVQSSGTPGAATPVIFAGVSQTNNNVYRSADGGVTWSNVSTIVSASYMPHHAAQDGLGNMYVAFNDTCGPNDSVAAGAVCKINLSTLASSDVSPGKQSGEQGGWGGVSVDLQHPTTLVVSTLDRWWPSPYDQIYRSTNGGASWKTTALSLPGTASAPWTVARTPHWCETVQIDPFNSNRAWYGTGYGIFSCTNLTASDSNGTVNWTFASDGLEETVPLGLASPPSGPYLLSQVGDQGGFRHFNVDVSPPAADYFSTHRGTSYGIDFAENNPNVIVRLFSGSPYGCYSVNGGTTWSDFLTNSLPALNGNGNVAVSADGSRFVWIPSTTASSNQIAYYSTDRGVTWTPSTGGPTGNRTPVADRVNSNKFYIYSSSSGGRFYVSTSGGASFSQGAAISASSSSLVPRTVFGREGDIWLPRGSSGLAHSTNSGSTFSTLANVQQAAYVACGRAAPGQSYPAVFISGQVGGVTGIFRSDDQGASWTRITDDQHQFGLSWVHAFCADPRIYGRIYFGTEGRGIIYGDIINTRPVFAPMGDQTVNVGSNLVCTASASDTNQPTAALSFNLLSAPANASLVQTNNTNAIFNWRPSVTNANTTNLISLMVAETANPSLSATQNFKVLVNALTLPGLSSVVLGNGQLTFLLSGGQAGPDYAVQASSNLVDWNTLYVTNWTGSSLQLLDTNTATLPAQFYRIKVGPPVP